MENNVGQLKGNLVYLWQRFLDFYTEPGPAEWRSYGPGEIMLWCKANKLSQEICQQYSEEKEGKVVDQGKILLEQEIQFCSRASDHLSEALNYALRLLGSPYKREEIVFHLNKARETLDELLAETQAELIERLANPPTKPNL